MRIFIGLSAFLLGPAPVSISLAGQPPNVLFIAIDDLRDDLGALGVAYAKTPNLDALAADSRLFSRHYVQVPTCGASRRALLSGRRPSLPAHISNNAIRDTHNEWGSVSMPAWFRKHGYKTLALGKITHYPGGLTGPEWASPPEELPGAWDRAWIPGGPWKTPLAIMHGFANGTPRNPGVSPPMEAYDGPDSSYPDWWVAKEAVETLRDLAETDGQPWFFAVGFFKPHLPFAAPKRWYELHNPDDIPAPAVTRRPEGPSAWHQSREFRGNYGHDGRDPETDPDYAALVRQAYAAATSYMDAQVGVVVDALRDLGSYEDTVIVVWSDHGFLLGEHAIWGKHCLYENAQRSPLMIRYAGLPHAGTPTSAIVETVDVYPTLLELCNLPKPEGLDGRSLRPQLSDPTAASSKPALGFWSKGQRSVRNDRWRLIAHLDEAGSNGQPAVELFDMQSDSSEAENVASENPDIAAELLAIISADGA